MGVSEEMIFMLVLWSTLGRCWMVSWVRGETGECWWLWECEDERLLGCSVPGESTRKGCLSSLSNSPDPTFQPGGRMDSPQPTWSPDGRMLHCGGG